MVDLCCVVVDGDFIQAALEGRIMLRDQLPKLLQEDTVPCVTRCVLHDLRKRGNMYRGATMIAEKSYMLRCEHPGVLSPLKCIERLIQGGNPHGFLVGAQNIELRRTIRATPGVPLLFVRGSVPIVEAPSEAEEKAALDAKMQRSLQEAVAFEKQQKKLAREKRRREREQAEKEARLTNGSVQQLRAMQPGDAAAASTSSSSNGGLSKKQKALLNKKKKPKAPNPLSVKKRKKPKQQDILQLSKEERAKLKAARAAELAKKKRKERRKRKLQERKQKQLQEQQQQQQQSDDEDDQDDQEAARVKRRRTNDN
eukprot:TRINITY_DN65949_c12_g1_i4.p1 TRINITY_DN65949_c12_g1~~TRINITY_DN65949_c12_g1_i4.p1  ORF type:complete len:311 (-),score=158.99 TRINITY_DN65949_c12_g1_i4:255-1187(-)